MCCLSRRNGAVQIAKDETNGLVFYGAAGLLTPKPPLRADRTHFLNGRDRHDAVGRNVD